MEVADPLLIPTEVPNLHGSPGEDRDSGWAKPELCFREPLACIACPFLTQHKGDATEEQGHRPLSVGLVGAPPCQLGGSWRAGGVGCVPQAACPGSGMTRLGSRCWWHLFCLWHCPRDPPPPVHALLCGDIDLPRLGRERASSSHSSFSCFSELLHFKVPGGFLQEKNTEFSLFLCTMSLRLFCL